MKCQLEYIFIIWLYVLLPCSDIVKAEPLSSDHLPCKVHKLTVHTVEISLFSKFLCCIVLRLKSSQGSKFLRLCLVGSGKVRGWLIGKIRLQVSLSDKLVG
jgi:hypothetical protein